MTPTLPFSWPMPMMKLAHLTGALKAGFALRQLPPSHNASAAQYALYRGIERAPVGILQQRFVVMAQREGLLEKGETCDDGSIVFRLKARSPKL